MLDSLDPRLRGKIMVGMRWTLWLSVISIPFSYAITILLARCGPEVIGTYGLLTVYIGVVASLLYLGGDTVIIKFVPDSGVANEVRVHWEVRSEEGRSV